MSTTDTGLVRHVYDGERCRFCGANVYDADTLGIACVPREPMTWTSETPAPDAEHREKATATALCACGAAPDGYGLPTDHGQWMVWDQWLREHIAAARGERDERLREAMGYVEGSRTMLRPPPMQRAFVTLGDEVARLDAVVTAVREAHSHISTRWVGFPRADRQERYCLLDGEAEPCSTRRLLDGDVS